MVARRHHADLARSGRWPGQRPLRRRRPRRLVLRHARGAGVLPAVVLGQLTVAPGSLRRRAGAPSGTSTHSPAEIDEARDTYGGQHEAKEAMANSPGGGDRYSGRDQREDPGQLEPEAASDAVVVELRPGIRSLEDAST